MELFNVCRTAYAGGEMPFTLHLGMFADVVKSQATKEQIERWLPKILSHQMLGTYAQTELGHGGLLYLTGSNWSNKQVPQFNYSR